MPLDEVQANGALRITGNAEIIERFRRLFSLPQPAPTASSGEVSFVEKSGIDQTRLILAAACSVLQSGGRGSGHRYGKSSAP